MNYRLVRGRRRGIRIRVFPDGQVEVRAPARMSATRIDQVLAEHSDWILCKQQQMKQKKTAAELFDGGSILLFGEVYPVQCADVEKPQWDTSAFLVPNADVQRVHKDVVSFLKRLLLPVVSKAVQDICMNNDLNWNGIRINSAVTRWGSCNKEKGNLNFSYRLAFLPRELIEAVAAHECAHLVYADHSARFWQTVARLDPDFKRHREQLRIWERMYHFDISVGKSESEPFSLTNN